MLLKTFFSVRSYKVWITCRCGDKYFMNGPESRIGEEQPGISKLQDTRQMTFRKIRSIYFYLSRSSSLSVIYLVSANIQY